MKLLAIIPDTPIYFRVKLFLHTLILVASSAYWVLLAKWKPGRRLLHKQTPKISCLTHLFTFLKNPSLSTNRKVAV